VRACDRAVPNLKRGVRVGTCSWRTDVLPSHFRHDLTCLHSAHFLTLVLYLVCGSCSGIPPTLAVLSPSPRRAVCCAEWCCTMEPCRVLFYSSILNILCVTNNWTSCGCLAAFHNVSRVITRLPPLSSGSPGAVVPRRFDWATRTSWRFPALGVPTTANVGSVRLSGHRHHYSLWYFGPTWVLLAMGALRGI
jgi:hypothetical protein